MQQATVLGFAPDAPLAQCMQQRLMTLAIPPFSGAPVQLHTVVH